MSSNVYTLPELVDLALRTPEVGAVNFNILRIILHKILTECKLQNVTGEWKPFPVPSAPVKEVLEDEKLPDHPLLKRIEEEKAKTKSVEPESVTPEEETLVKDAVETSKSSEEMDTEASKDAEGRESVDELQISESSTETEESDEEDIPKKYKSKKKHKFLKESSEEIRKEAKSKKKSKISKDTAEPGGKRGSGPPGGMFQLWELKKLVKRIEGVEEELNYIVTIVDELREWREAKAKRFLLLEGEEFESGYTGPTVGREEFEDTVEEFGEALALISMRCKKQKENYDTVNKDILNEMRQRPTQEEMNQNKEELNKKLNTLSGAIRSMQKLIKDIIYPETCGTTKCLSCKRKAHLPLSGMVIDHKKGIYTDTTKRNLMNVVVTKSSKTMKPSHELRFTTTCLKRIIGENGKPKDDGEKSFATLKQEEKDKHFEEPAINENLINLEAFEVTNLSSDFAPLRPLPDLLRRDCVHLPSNRPKKAPVTISIGSSGTSIIRKK